MLSQLTIQNFGLINKISLEFDEHLNILTGETGAGKSIIIDALRIVLGDRISSSSLRDPQASCILEAVFDLSQNKDLKKLEILQDFLSQEDSQLIINRTLDPSGRSKIKINGLNVTVGQLSEVGNHLIDFHGAHDHQMLLSADSHLGMLDRLVSFENILDEYQAIFVKYQEIDKKLAQLKELAQSRDRELDLLTHQVKELEQVSLDEAKYEELIQEQTKINNAERLYVHVNSLLAILEGDGEALSERIRGAFPPMRNLNQIDEKTVHLMDYLNQIQDNSSQLANELQDYAQSLSFEPEEARKINDLCDSYDNIKRKYGPTLAEAKIFYTQAKEKYDLLLNLEHNDSQLRKDKDELEKKLKQAAAKITKERKKTATTLKTTIEKELSELGMPHVKFDVRIEPGAFTHHGQDHVTFFISPNAGESLKPLAEIVSSGEAARVMLALKKALVKVDPVPVLIFDEIDAQIGGRLGTVTGEKLRELAKVRQVILITHLPQIASYADVHFKVIKAVESGRATTKVELLNKESRVKELAKMMSGEEETKIALKHAQDMLAQARK